MANWNYRICNRDGSNEREILNAYERKFTDPLGRMPTASGRVRLDHPLADRILTDDLYLKVYRDAALKLVGPIISTEESGEAENQTIQFNAVSGFWYLLRRLLGKDTAGWSLGTAGSLYSRSYIAQQLVLGANGESFTGIDVGTIDTLPANAHFGPNWFFSVGEALTELAVGANSYEWSVTPVDPTDPATPSTGGIKRIGLFNALSLVGGVQRDNVVFQYGVSRPSIATYKRTFSREQTITKAWSLPNGFPTIVGAPVGESAIVSTTDATAVTARGLLEETISSEVTPNELRQALCDAHIAVRKGPRLLVTLTLAQNATPVAYGAYQLGDIIRVLIFVNGRSRLDGYLRVWGISTSIDNAGNELVELELSDSGV